MSDVFSESCDDSVDGNKPSMLLRRGASFMILCQERKRKDCVQCEFAKRKCIFVIVTICERDKSLRRKGSIKPCNIGPLPAEGKSTKCKSGCCFFIANSAKHTLEAQSNPGSALNQSIQLRGKDVIV